jgi:iron complex transport system ATP-binding protein
MKNSYLIDLRDISIDRGGRRVLSHISWSTRFGEHWFIMGNNGSGKTTLLEIVMGYLWPQHGSVTVLGKRFGQVYLQDLRKQIGYVSPWVFSHTGDYIPVEDVVASGLDGSVGYFGTIPGSIQQKISRQLNFFHCESLEKRLFGNLSSGQQLKIMLARALIGRPRILILDEPFSLLDIGSRFSMYHFIKKISKNRPATQIIMVTHHIDDIISVFTHGLVIKEGRIFSQGERGKILNGKTLSEAFDLPGDSLTISSTGT